MQTLEGILEDIKMQVIWHGECLGNSAEGSERWGFHLGWVDALTSYRWKIEELLKQTNSNFLSETQ